MARSRGGHSIPIGLPKRERYAQLEDDFVGTQYEQEQRRDIPWSAISLSIVLFLMGSILIIVGAMLLTGYIDSKYADRTWPLLLLGTIMFIPGVYHVRIVYYVYKGYKGYTLDDIPNFD